MPQPNLEIMTFVERQILPRYNAFGQSHGLGHVQRVIRNSLALAAVTGADVNMVYVIAAYHDLKIMKEAVEDHRASSSRTPRSIYGKIVAEADRDLEPEVVFLRAILFGIENYPEMDEDQMWERFHTHMKEKYGRTGYLRLWIPGSPNARNLEAIRKTIDNETELHEVFRHLYSQIHRKIE